MSFKGFEAEIEEVKKVEILRNQIISLAVKLMTQDSESNDLGSSLAELERLLPNAEVLYFGLKSGAK